MDTLNDPDATPEELLEAAATLNGLADAFAGSGFERAWDHDNDKDTPAQPITAAAQLRMWAGYAGDRAGHLHRYHTGTSSSYHRVRRRGNQNLAADPNVANATVNITDTDEDGKPIPERDENGETKVDAEGKPVYRTKTITLADYITVTRFPGSKGTWSNRTNSLHSMS